MGSISLGRRALLAASAGLAAAATGRGAVAQGAAIRIGELNSYSRMAAFCIPYRNAMQMAAEQINAAGQVEVKLKAPWRDGTTHLVMSPMEFMQRLAALVPRPRLRPAGSKPSRRPTTKVSRTG